MGRTTVLSFWEELLAFFFFSFVQRGTGFVCLCVGFLENSSSFMYVGESVPIAASCHLLTCAICQKPCIDFSTRRLQGKCYCLCWRGQNGSLSGLSDISSILWTRETTKIQTWHVLSPKLMVLFLIRGRG